MNKLGLAIMVLLLVSGIAGAAMVLMESEPEEPQVIYHGNGGVDGNVTTYSASNVFVSPCLFTNEGKTFYMWNTQPDATGDFYSPNNNSDSDKLLDSGVKDLYAIWVYKFTGNNFSSSDSSKYFTNLLFNNNSFLEPQPMIGIPIYLDPSANIARMQFSIADFDVTWNYHPESFTVQGNSADYTYTITFSGVLGAENFRLADSDGGSVSIDFDYSSDVHIDISSSSKKF